MKRAVGEASSSRSESPERQKLHPVLSFTEDNAAIVPDSGKLYELDLLNCPVCYEALSVPIFQCENGHVACPSCCKKMRNKCPFCTLPTGKLRCRIIERVVDAIFVPCPNFKYGCNMEFAYGNDLHEKFHCDFAPRRCCPAPNCKYESRVFKDLYSHYHVKHKNSMKRFFLNRR